MNQELYDTTFAFLFETAVIDATEAELAARIIAFGDLIRERSFEEQALISKIHAKMVACGVLEHG